MVLSKGLVAVTGASGYLGSWCVKYLVENGYQARGTVRSLKSAAKVQHLLDMKEPVELFEADLLQEGSFDACFTGCTAVLHVASPFRLHVDDPKKDLVDPAVKGTLNVLEACKRAGIKRVVLTSSCAAITCQTAFKNPEAFKDKVWSEKDWNEKSSLEEGPYRYSKYLAEKTAWEFCEKNGITLTTICPNFIVGPPLSTRIDSLSVKLFLLFLQGVFVKEGVSNAAFGCVDVRTVAEAHILSLQIQGAENERFLIGGRVSRNHLDLINWLRLDQRFAALKMASHFATPVITCLNYDNSKAVKVLGLKFKPPVIAVLEVGDFFVEKGMIKLPEEEKELPEEEKDDSKLAIE